jgi:hypothetical protein
MLSAFSQRAFGFIIIRMNIHSEGEFWQQVFFNVVILGILFGIIWNKVKIISIDTVNKNISFRNILAGKTKTYPFAELDGYFDTFTKHVKSIIRSKTVGFMQDKRVVMKIDSFYCSNFKELRDALKDLSYLDSTDLDSRENQKKES